MKIFQAQGPRESAPRTRHRRRGDREELRCQGSSFFTGATRHRYQDTRHQPDTSATSSPTNLPSAPAPPVPVLPEDLRLTAPGPGGLSPFPQGRPTHRLHCESLLTRHVLREVFSAFCNSSALPPRPCPRVYPVSLLYWSVGHLSEMT